MELSTEWIHNTVPHEGSIVYKGEAKSTLHLNNSWEKKKKKNIIRIVQYHSAKLQSFKSILERTKKEDKN